MTEPNQTAEEEFLPTLRAMLADMRQINADLRAMQDNMNQALADLETTRGHLAATRRQLRRANTRRAGWNLFYVAIFAAGVFAGPFVAVIFRHWIPAWYALYQ